MDWRSAGVLAEDKKAETGKADESRQAGILRPATLQFRFCLSHSHYPILSFYAEGVNGKMRMAGDFCKVLIIRRLHIVFCSKNPCLRDLLGGVFRQWEAAFAEKPPASGA